MRWLPAYVGVGSNLADPRRQVETAIEALAAIEDTHLVLRSSCWRSRPLGPQDQPLFVNAAAGLLTTKTPRELLADLQAIEQRMGRTEPAVHWGPRLIDLDLLVFSESRVDEPGLRLPHPGVHERNFVLYPLSEIADELWVPGLARVRALRERVTGEGIERLAARESGDD